MNLLPDTEKEDLKKGLKARWIIVSAFMLSASFLAGLVVLLPPYFLTLGNLYRVDRESYSLNSKNEDLAKELLSLPEEVDSKLKFLQSRLADVSAFDSFSQIVELLPPGVELNFVSFARNRNYGDKSGLVISVSGTALNRDSLVFFSDLLKESKMFSSVDIPVSSLVKGKDLPFDINVFIEK